MVIFSGFTHWKWWFSIVMFSLPEGIFGVSIFRVCITGVYIICECIIYPIWPNQYVLYLILVIIRNYSIWSAIAGNDISGNYWKLPWVYLSLGIILPLQIAADSWVVKSSCRICPCQLQYMVVSWNGGTRKSSIFIGFSILNHRFWVPPC